MERAARRLNKDPAKRFWLWAPDEIDPEPGDILCKNRGGSNWDVETINEDLSDIQNADIFDSGADSVFGFIRLHTHPDPDQAGAML